MNELQHHFLLSESALSQLENILNRHAACFEGKLEAVERDHAACPCGHTCSGSATDICEACHGFFTIG